MTTPIQVRPFGIGAVRLACLALVVSFLAALALAARADAGNIYVSGLGNRIAKTNMDGTGGVLLADGSNGATGVNLMALDGKHVYWAVGRDVPNGGVWVMNLDGTDKHKLVDGNNGGSFVSGVAVDDTYVYWANTSGTHSIGRAKLDGTEVNQNFITGVSSPSGIVVNSSFIYWSNGSTNTIGRASINGSNVNQSWVSGSGLAQPTGLAINSTHIIWANTSPGTNTIIRASLADPTVKATLANAASGVNNARGVGVDSNYFYWANFGGLGGTTFGRAFLDATSPNGSFITSGPSFVGTPMSILAQRNSSTSVSCSPEVVGALTPTTCTAVVTDTDLGAAARPDGKVKFRSNVGGGFFGDDGGEGDEACTLVPLTVGKSSCSVTYSPGDAGAEVLTGEYQGNGRYVASSQTDSLTVELPPHPTGTALDCSPASPTIGAEVACTVTVTDTGEADNVPPTGDVEFESTSTEGGFDSDGCTLAPAGIATSTCTVGYTTGELGSITISADYQGNVQFLASSANDNLAVNPVPPHPTATAVACVPATVPLDSPTLCTATVTDTTEDDPGSPSGEVGFSSPGGSFSEVDCTLSSSGPDESVCAVSFIPSSAGAQTVTAAYAGVPELFAASSGQAIVNKPADLLPPPAPLPPAATGERAKALKKCKKKKGKKSKRKCKTKAKKLPV